MADTLSWNAVAVHHLCEPVPLGLEDVPAFGFLGTSPAPPIPANRDTNMKVGLPSFFGGLAPVFARNDVGGV